MGQDIEESIVLAALVKIFNDIVNFIPNLVNGLIILLAGYLVARLVSSLIGFILRQIKFDPLVERTGITGALRGLGVKTPLWQLVSQIIYSRPARPILARGVIRVYNAL